MTSDPRLRVGIIGTGWMADMIVPDFRRVDAFDLVAVAGRDAARTRAFAEERGIPSAETVDGLLGRDDLDLVYIATTHDSHAELARRAIEHGIARAAREGVHDGRGRGRRSSSRSPGTAACS